MRDCNVKYTFGTGNENAARLGEIAKFFNPLAAALVQQYVADSPGVAVDVGCGPGFTTDMLYHAAKPREIHGLDKSPEFLAIARDQFPRYSFLEHDITTVPFPVTADVMYARFILSHLPRPVEVVRNWVTQLAVGGILVIEEVEAVETDVGLFRTYLSTNEALVASQGANLFVGGELAGQDYNAHKLLDDCPVLPVPDSQAATWFLPNTKTIWRQSDLVRERLSSSEIERVSDALSELVRSGEQSSHITWRMRRIVLRRR
jgi:trans-aconitate 2-methyltransferase